MIRKYLLVVLAILGVVTIVIAVILDNASTPAVSPAPQWPKVPFAAYVAGAGIVEASSGNIAVGTGVPGIVTSIYVKAGERVMAGAALFKTDERDLSAQRRLALASVREAEAKLAQARDQSRLVDAVPDRRALSTEEINLSRSALAIAGAARESAQARVAQLDAEIDRRTVRALAPGTILQVNIRPGEYAQSGVLVKPLILLGNDERLYLRVDIDEFDAARIVPGAAAIAFVRGSVQRQASLRFERIEPYVVAKTALTGGGAERVDTRVLQVIYSVERGALPAYIGQQLNVLIEAPLDKPPERAR